MTVICSIRAGDIDLSRAKTRGPELLRAYLDYAERGPETLGETISSVGGRGFDSPFAQEVYVELVRDGMSVHPQVGCGGFRIDLALVDPARPGRYLLGVECDGATYHSSPTARDRDRLRQEVLESLGWVICRIWSTDWWHVSPRTPRSSACESLGWRGRRELTANGRPAPATTATDAAGRRAGTRRRESARTRTRVAGGTSRSRRCRKMSCGRQFATCSGPTARPAKMTSSRPPPGNWVSRGRAGASRRGSA